MITAADTGQLNLRFILSTGPGISRKGWVCEGPFFWPGRWFW